MLELPNIVLPDPLHQRLRDWTPRSQFGIFAVSRVLPHLPEDVVAEFLDRLSSIAVVETSLALKVLRSRDSRFYVGADIEDHGIVSRRVVTTAGVGFIVDAFQNSTELEDQKFHGIGTGVAAEAVGDTALGTELTTEYNPNSTRATGTQTENGANAYQTVGTNTLDSGTPAVTEHGILTSATVGSGVLLDRSVFAAINLDGTAGDGLQSTYDFTVTAGS